jgi:2-hydroxychromene-2-carboxylate isomerase
MNRLTTFGPPRIVQQFLEPSAERRASKAGSRMDHIVRFYFSFRSPYAWLAAERWQAELGDLEPTVQRIPFFPTRETFPNDPAQHPSKLLYIVQDLARLTRDFGLSLRPPPALETDWKRAHAAYLGVEAQQPLCAEPFMLEMFRARFSRGQDVGRPEVIADAAARAGADVRLTLDASESAPLQDEVSASFMRGQKRDRIFGAPSFVYGGQLFWGHDRMHHLRRALIEGRAGRSAAATV